MKTIILLIMAAMTVLSASARTEQTEQTDQTEHAGIRDSIMNYLKVEGYVPKLDTDGDIAFKVSGTSHYIRIYDGNDNGFCYLELFCLYNKENATLDRVAYTANNTNQSYKQVRVSYSQVDGTEGEFKILFETPSFISTGEEFNKLLPEYLECIDSASDHFFEIYDFE